MVPALIYGQVKKTYRRRKVVRVTHVMRCGTVAAFRATLCALGLSGRLNTAFVERVNLPSGRGSQRWRDEHGPPPRKHRHSRHNSNGGAATITVYDCMRRCVYRWHTQSRGVGGGPRGDIGNGRRRWQLG